jgi:hypothetical protein
MRNWLVTLLVLAVSQAALAQKLQFGLQRGFGAAQLSNYWQVKNDRWGADWVKSPLLGGFAAVYCGKNTALGLEMSRVTKGNARYAVINRYHYAQFSPYLKWDFMNKNDKKWVGYGKLGGYFSVLTDQTQEYVEGSFAQIYLLEYGNVEDYDYGLNASIGAGYELGDNIRLNVEARAEHGLYHLFSLNPGESAAKRNISAWLMLSISYTLPSPYQQGILK